MNSIKRLRVALKLKQSELAEKLNVSTTTVQNWENGRSNPNINAIKTIEEVFGISFKLGADAFDDEYIYVPLLDEVQAAAGAGAEVYGEQSSRKIVFRRDFINSHNIVPNKLTAITVVGDSMTPTLKSGDTILVDGAQNTPVHGRIYVFRESNYLMVKRFGGFKTDERGRQFATLVSDNPMIKEYAVDRSELAVIGRVVCGVVML